MQDIIIGDQFLPKVLPLIASAKSSIKIIIFDWRVYVLKNAEPISQFNNALLDANKRGVKIQAIVSSPIVANQLKNLGLEANTLKNQKLVHAKMMLIDDLTAVIGSHNYSASAFSANLELSVIVTLPSADNELTSFFKNLWPL